jgi:carbonic anhydrase/acetyltransferase-like protein (isoleucine patch superfamily)
MDSWQSLREDTMPRYALGDLTPTIDPTAFIHPEATVIGDVTIGPQSSVWPGAVLRGDRGRIVVGAQTSIQDGAIVHCNAQFDTIIGARCVIGHLAHLEGCTVADDCLIGAGAVVLSGAVVGPVALVGAAALVPPGKVVPRGARALGVPANIQPDVMTIADMSSAVRTYVENTEWYRTSLRRLDEPTKEGT